MDGWVGRRLFVGLKRGGEAREGSVFLFSLIALIEIY